MNPLNPMLCRPFVSLCAALTLCAILVAGCDRAGKSSAGNTHWIDPNKLQVGPIRHPNLTADQISRIQKLQKTFEEVDPSSLEEWSDGFKRDADPDRELTIWEDMATAYATFTATNALTLDGKKEVFKIALLRSAASEDKVLKNLKLQILTEKDARAIMSLFAGKPEPLRVVSP
ncbi:MAG TPA: hypothetical protein VL527_13040 [Dongiaceae bacterium]|jgi:hypothetical protein|nr:hypothetical protein [Dongiaceae bacterium]